MIDFKVGDWIRLKPRIVESLRNSNYLPDVIEVFENPIQIDSIVYTSGQDVTGAGVWVPSQAQFTYPEGCSNSGPYYFAVSSFEPHQGSSKNCQCDIVNLMNLGCQCGAFGNETRD